METPSARLRREITLNKLKNFVMNSKDPNRLLTDILMITPVCGDLKHYGKDNNSLFELLKNFNIGLIVDEDSNYVRITDPRGIIEFYDDNFGTGIEFVLGELCAFFGMPLPLQNQEFVLESCSFDIANHKDYNSKLSIIDNYKSMMKTRHLNKSYDDLTEVIEDLGGDFSGLRELEFDGFTDVVDGLVLQSNVKKSRMQVKMDVFFTHNDKMNQYIYSLLYHYPHLVNKISQGQAKKFGSLTTSLMKEYNTQEKFLEVAAGVLQGLKTNTEKLDFIANICKRNSLFSKMEPLESIIANEWTENRVHIKGKIINLKSVYKKKKGIGDTKRLEKCFGKNGYKYTC